MTEEKAKCTEDINRLLEEREVIQRVSAGVLLLSVVAALTALLPQTLTVVLDQLVLKNEGLARLVQERSVFDKAIEDMEMAFHQILNSSAQLVNVAMKETDAIARNKQTMDLQQQLAAQGYTPEEQRDFLHQQRMEREQEMFEKMNPGHMSAQQQMEINQGQGQKGGGRTVQRGQRRQQGAARQVGGGRR
jgi:hypothetical protein